MSESSAIRDEMSLYTYAFVVKYSVYLNVLHVNTRGIYM